MDEAHVTETAAKHLTQIREALHNACCRTGPKPGAIFERDFPGLIAAMDEEAKRYCATYNQAFGYPKLVCHSDESNSNISVESEVLAGSAARLEFSVPKRRVAYCGIEAGDRESKVLVELVEQESGLVLTLNGVEVTPEQAITTLLDEFTERLTEAECAEL